MDRSIDQPCPRVKRRLNPGSGIRTLWAVIFFLASGSAWGQEVSIDNFSGVGARAMGMGGAYIGVADDFSATYWNPAGLAQIKRAEIYGAIIQSRHETETSFFGTKRSDDISNTPLGSLGFVYPVPVYQGSLVFAIGYNRIKDFDSSIRYEGVDDTIFEYKNDVQQRDEGGLGVFSIAGATDISPFLSLGLGLNIWDGDDEFSQRADLSAKSFGNDPDTNPDLIGLFNKISRSDEYSGFNAKFGMLIKGGEHIRLGVTVSSPVTYKIKVEGRSEFADTLWFEEEPDSVTIDFRDPTPFLGEYKIRIPFEFGIGGSLSFPSFTLSADMSFTSWDQTEFKEDPIFTFQDEFRDETSFVEDIDEDGKADFDRQLKGVTRFHVGAEYSLPLVEVKLRGGFYRDPLSFVGPTLTVLGELPVDIKDDRDFITLGAGVLIDQSLQLDFAWSRAVFRQIRSEVDRDEKTSRLFFSGSYKF